ncbi:helix-turn-helix domain-containing protein [Lapidilactobacillus luobeiensis]|uniref:helix-turn-helix domain-containing protein n=1 Tax=Lapidilactobacillus luobeiensis TaxID=2950371 RepID=UPI0021C39161|nr:helix-turn-helix transcriptional regulator [Lapidilactobacillus luobeiensis]
MTNNLGQYLREIRGKRSLREISEMTNGRLSHTAIANIEKGTNGRKEPVKPSPDTLKILADVYHIDYVKLLNMAGYINKKDEEKDKNTVDLDDENAVLTFQGKPVPPEDLALMRRLLRGKDDDE